MAKCPEGQCAVPTKPTVPCYFRGLGDLMVWADAECWLPSWVWFLGGSVGLDGTMVSRSDLQQLDGILRNVHVAMVEYPSGPLLPLFLSSPPLLSLLCFMVRWMLSS